MRGCSVSSPERWNGGWPSRRVASVEASDQMSDAAVAETPEMTSGAAWARLPVIVALLVEVPPWILATPKSASCGSPYAEISTFSGLISRCRTPDSCAVANAPDNLTPMSATSSQPSGPLVTRAAREPPGR